MRVFPGTQSMHTVGPHYVQHAAPSQCDALCAKTHVAGSDTTGEPTHSLNPASQAVECKSAPLHVAILYHVNLKAVKHCSEV